MNEKHKRWADALRDKYVNILSNNGELVDADYENMVTDVQKCTEKDPSCRAAMFDVLEEFDRSVRRKCTV